MKRALAVVGLLFAGAALDEWLRFFGVIGASWDGARYPIVSAFITGCFTLAGGVCVFTLGEWVKRFVFDPAMGYREAVKEVERLLLLEGDSLLNWPHAKESEYKPADWLVFAEKRRGLAQRIASCWANLSAANHALIPWPWCRSLMRVPQHAVIVDVCFDLLSLSNCMVWRSPSGNDPDSHDLRKGILTKLDAWNVKLEPLTEKR